MSDVTTPPGDLPPLAAGRARGWDACGQCDAPLDERQRYCVVCGAHRGDADDPAARFIAAARRARQPAEPAPPARSRQSSALTATIVALLPLAVGVGVLVGRGDAGGDDRVLAALKAQKAPVVTVVGGGESAATASAATVASDFPHAGGFTVALRTLPVAGTTAEDVAAAIKGLRARGARDVGVVAPADFAVTPSSGDVYTLVSGRFPTRAAAARTLRRLRTSFRSAKVVEVRPAGGNAATTGGEAPVIASGPTGEAHRLEGSAPSQRQLEDSAKAIDTINKAKGKAYVESQRNLPDSIVIP